MTFSETKTPNTQYHLDPWYLVIRNATEEEIAKMTINYGNRGDALITTSLAMIAYDNYEHFLQGLIQCLRPVNGKVEIWRHPEFTRENYGFDTSRDQVTMMIVALKYRKINSDLSLVLNCLEWRISDKHTQTLDMWLWQKSIKRNSKIIAGLHNLMMIPLVAFQCTYEILLRKWFGVYEISQADYFGDNYKVVSQENKDKYKKLRIWPDYAVHLFSWQLFVMPETFLLRVLRKVTLWNAQKSLAIQMLLGANVTRKQIDDYVPMMGRAFSGRLTNISTSKANTEYTENNIDVAVHEMLFKLMQG